MEKRVSAPTSGGSSPGHSSATATLPRSPRNKSKGTKPKSEPSERFTLTRVFRSDKRGNKTKRSKSRQPSEVEIGSPMEAKKNWAFGVDKEGKLDLSTVPPEFHEVVQTLFENVKKPKFVQDRIDPDESESPGLSPEVVRRAGPRIEKGMEDQEILQQMKQLTNVIPERNDNDPRHPLADLFDIVSYFSSFYFILCLSPLKQWTTCVINGFVLAIT